MAQVRLLVIPHGQDKDAEGKGHGSDWPLADLGHTDTAHVTLTTDHAHASEVCDDDVVGNPESLGKFIVEALNNRPPVGLYRAAARLWGVDAQFLMLAEECAEASVAVLHLGRGRDGAREALIGELADLRVMVEQVTCLLGADADVQGAYEAKVERLLGRVRKADAERRKANPPPPPKPLTYTPPDPTAKNCGTCRHWKQVLEQVPEPEDTLGVCDNPTAPWQAWREPDDAWAAAADSGDVRPCHEAKETAP